MKNIRRMLTMLVALAVILGTVYVPMTAKAASSSVTRIWVDSYNDSVPLREGQKLTQEVIDCINFKVCGDTVDEEKVPIDSRLIKVKEKNTYIHSKNGRINLTLSYKNVSTVLTLRVKTKASKLTVKVKGSLNEAQIVKLNDVNKALKTTLTWSTGKTQKNFKGYRCKEEGKTVKANKNGKMKLTVFVGKVKKTANVPVNPLKRIFIGSSKISALTEGDPFNQKNFKEKNSVWGVYKKGAKKKLTTYSISAPKTVKANSKGKFVVTVKYGKFSDKIAIPVVPPIKKFTASVEVEGPGNATVNNQQAVTLAEGTEVSYVASTTEVFVGWRKDGSIVSTNPNFSFTLNEDVVLTAVFEKKPIPPKTFTASVEVEGPGTATVNGQQSVKVTEGTEVSYVASTTEVFVGWRKNGVIISTNPTFAFGLVENTAITAVFAKKETPYKKVRVSTNGGNVTIDGKSTTEKAVPVGTAVLLEAKNSDHFKFLQWEDEKGNPLSTDAKFAFVVKEDTNVFAKFDEVYKLSVETVNGNVEMDGKTISSIELSKGNYTLSAVADEGFEIDFWKDAKGNILGTTSNLTITLDKDTTITVVFKRIECEVTVKSNRSNTIKLNGSNLNFKDGVATATFEAGTKISLSTQDSSDARFLRWVNEVTGEELSTEKTYVVTVKSDMTIVAVYEDVKKVTIERVGGKGKVTVAGETLDFYGNVAEYATVPGKIEFVAQSTDDYVFVRWEKNGQTLSTEENLTLPVTESTKITVVFAEAEKTATVEYRWDNGTTLQIDAVPFGETLKISEDVVAKLWRSTQTFVGWSVNNVLYEGKYNDDEFYNADGQSLTTAVKELTAQKKNVLAITVYTDNPKNMVDIHVTNGKAFQNGEVVMSVEEGTGITLTADVPEGKYFWYWADVEGTPLSYKDNWDLVASSEVNVQAVFSDTQLAPGATVFFNGEGTTVYSLEKGDDKNAIVVHMGCAIPQVYSKLEWGFLIASDSIADEDLVYENGGKDDTDGWIEVHADDVENTKHSNLANCEYNLSFKDQSDSFVNHKTMKVRLYAVIQSTSGGTEYIYSNIVNVTP